MSDDLGKTDANLGYRLVKADIASLKDTITERFDRIDKRLDMHGQADRELEKRVSALELLEARQEGSNFNQRLAAVSTKISENRKTIDELNAFRWKLIGVSAAMAALAGGGAAAVFKLIGGN